MADVKWGGLRRDLSLAFEMDGVEEAENATLFNSQIGEFVGSGNPSDDPFSAPDKPSGLPDFERFLWRVTSESNTPFAGDISSQSNRRGKHSCFKRS